MKQWKSILLIFATILASSSVWGQISLPGEESGSTSSDQETGDDVNTRLFLNCRQLNQLGQGILGLLGRRRRSPQDEVQPRFFCPPDRNNNGFFGNSGNNNRPFRPDRPGNRPVRPDLESNLDFCFSCDCFSRRCQRRCPAKCIGRNGGSDQLDSGDSDRISFGPQ